MKPPESDAARRDRVLRARALQLAQEAERPAAGADLELLAFELAQETYSVETRFVREVITLKDLAPVPCTPPHFLGIVNLRGEICPVIDLKRLFGLPERGLTNATRAVVVRGGGLEFGIVADAVAEVRRVPIDAVLPPPPTLTGIHAEFLRGVTGEHLIVLDAGRVLGHSAMIVREEVGDLG